MKTARLEFISLMALLMSLLALSIDAVLPALSTIGVELGAQSTNDSQNIISVLFLGMSGGLMIYGPLSDTIGRKKAIYYGIAMFLAGSLVSILSTSMTTMLLGRAMQGFGAAACRIVPMAMVRDLYDGQEMGKIMSLIMMVFIMVPALAPSVGQAILLVFTWKAIFGMTTAVAILGLSWLHFRQPETLHPEYRIPFSVKTLLSGAIETITNRTALTFTVAGGILFSAFIGYISTAQQVFQFQYQLGDSFPIYFGAIALVIGLASFANAKLLSFYRMEAVCVWSLSVMFMLTGSLIVLGAHTHPPLWGLMTYLAAIFFCFGLLIGNLNTIAIKPLGHIAGIANSVISSIQTFIAVLIGGVIGSLYAGSLAPLVWGYLGCSAVALLLIRWQLRD